MQCDGRSCEMGLGRFEPSILGANWIYVAHSLQTSWKHALLGSGTWVEGNLLPSYEILPPLLVRATKENFAMHAWWQNIAKHWLWNIVGKGISWTSFACNITICCTLCHYHSHVVYSLGTKSLNYPYSFVNTRVEARWVHLSSKTENHMHS